MRTLDVYVLGAGASYAHGAPLTDQILPYALTESEFEGDKYIKLVKTFLEDAFNFRASGKYVEPKHYPSLVDVLSVVDLALDRKENLARRYPQEKLRKIRQALDYAIFSVLEHSLSGRAAGQPWPWTRTGTLAERPRSKATWHLVRTLKPEDTVIISFNYDVIVDVALAHHNQKEFPDYVFEQEPLFGTPTSIDYGVEFARMPSPARSRAPRFRLFKLHGSFNWLRSRITGELYFGGFHKAIGELYRRRPTDMYRNTGERIQDLEPILITPTHLKDFRNAHLSALWRKAESALRQAKRITFIGYSLPGDDIHVKYLFKRAIETGREKKPQIVVVDKYAGSQVSPVLENYERFFGKKNIQHFHTHGFEQYVQDLMNTPS